jgi:hypothetical protein
VLASVHAELAAFDAKRLVQRDGFEVFDGHLSGEGDDVVELVYFAHRVVEDAGDDAAVGVARRSGVALAEAKLADEGLAGLVEDELQAHPVGIVHAADEAIVFLHFCVRGVVAVDLGLAWHGRILRDSGIRVEGRSSHLRPRSGRAFWQKRREVGTLSCGGWRSRDESRDLSTADVFPFRDALPPLRMTGYLGNHDLQISQLGIATSRDILLTIN